MRDIDLFIKKILFKNSINHTHLLFCFVFTKIGYFIYDSLYFSTKKR